MKLVRDRIPELFGYSKLKIANDEEYERALNEKLKEEVNEFVESKNIEELADILEVVQAIAENNGSDFKEILEMKEKKAEVRGRFSKKQLWKG